MAAVNPGELHRPLMNGTERGRKRARDCSGKRCARGAVLGTESPVALRFAWPRPKKKRFVVTAR